MQIIEDSGIGGSFGQAFGRGLQALAENKIQQMQQQAHQQRTQRGYEGLGYSKEEARALSMLPDKVQMEYLKEYGPSYQNQGQQDIRQLLSESFQQKPEEMSMFNEQQQGEDNTQGILNALSNLRPKNMEQEMIQNQVAKFLSPEQNEDLFRRYMEDALGRKPETAMQKASPLAPEVQQKGAMQEMKQKPISKEAIPLKRQMPEQPERRLSKSEIMAQRAAEKEEQKAEHLNIKEAEKASEPTYKETINNFKAAKASNKRLSRMRELIKEGKMSWPLWSSLTKTATKGIFGIGIDMSALTTPQTQEFDKLSTEFLKDAKSVFGSRITDQDLQAFMRMVPTSSMSDAGKLRVINNIEEANKAGEIRYKVMQDIIKENGGKRPAHLEELIEERAEPQLKKAADSFKDNLRALEKIESKEEKKIEDMSDFEKIKRILGY